MAEGRAPTRNLRRFMPGILPPTVNAFSVRTHTIPDFTTSPHLATLQSHEVCSVPDIATDHLQLRLADAGTVHCLQHVLASNPYSSCPIAPKYTMLMTRVEAGLKYRGTTNRQQSQANSFGCLRSEEHTSE